VDLGIAGRKAICAGASAGMGLASARALSREGVEVFISARGEDRLVAAAASVSAETGGKVTPVVADHSTPTGRAALLEACPEPDIMVITCSPPRTTEDFRDISVEDWRGSLATTMVAPIELMRLTVDGMAARGFGRIVNIATVAAKFPSVPRLLSGPARSGLLNYAVAVSKAMAKDNVIINTLLPGMFETETMTQRFRAEAAAKGVGYEEQRDRFVARFRIPTGRFGEPDELGAWCAMFCSRYAAYVVGQSLVLDGGLINGLY
jgi:3-oxoacyl-[acyl-carrier protein] reductase